MENHNLSYEPMDIDTSSNSVREMDISYNESFTMKTIKTEKTDDPIEEIKLTSSTRPVAQPQTQPIVKKYHLKIPKSSKSYKNVMYQISSVVIIILMSIFALHIYSLKCFDDFHYEELEHSLSNKLFGQTEAVNKIMQTLKLKERSKLLLFSGGTGVGKTYASSILLDSIGPCSNVYHYTMPSFTNSFSTDFMYGLTMCKNAIVIVDGLTAHDMHIKTQIRELLEKSKNLEKDITVILIYNCYEYESTNEFVKNCDETFRHRLLENFSDIKSLKTFIEFKPLTEVHLKECIKQELHNRRLGSKELEDIIKNFNVTVDGCKGVHSKMKYLNVV